MSSVTVASLEATIVRQAEEITRLRAQLSVAASIADNIDPTGKPLRFDVAALRTAIPDQVIDLTDQPAHLDGCPLQFTTRGECVCDLIVSVNELALRMDT